MTRAERIAAVFLMIMGLGMSGATAVRADDGAAPATLVVTGEGRVEAAPDMAVIPIGVETAAATAAAALADNNARIGAVIARLKAAGVADRDIQTSGLSLGPRYDYSAGSGSQKLAGYVAVNQVTVRVRALDRLGVVLDAVVADGANQFAGISLALQDPGPQLDEARRRAVADARARAALLAEAAGVRLGPVLSITEGSGAGQPLPMLRQSAAMAAEAVPVAAGELTLSAGVTLVFAIAP